MNRAVLTLALLLFAVAARATMTISLGTPFQHNGVTYVPIMGSNIPSKLSWFDSIGLTFTDSIAVTTDGAGSDTIQTVWPHNTWPTLPYGVGGADYVNQGGGARWLCYGAYQYEPTCFDGAASSGILATFAVTGCGSIALQNTSFKAAYVCLSTSPFLEEISFNVSETPVYIGCITGGGGGGLDEGMRAGTEAKPSTPAKRTTWGSIKAFYR